MAMDGRSGFYVSRPSELGPAYEHSQQPIRHFSLSKYIDPVERGQLCGQQPC